MDKELKDQPVDYVDIFAERIGAPTARLVVGPVVKTFSYEGQLTAKDMLGDVGRLDSDVQAAIRDLPLDVEDD